MADKEAQLAEEIARLEAELEKARLDSKLQSLKAELSVVEGELDDEVMVIRDLVDDTGEEEYEEFTENSYDEYEEEYIEEYEEVEYEEDYEEEYYEEEYIAEDEVVQDRPLLQSTPKTEQAPPRPAYSSLQKAHESLRQTPKSSYQQKEEEAQKAAAATAAAAPRETAPPEKPKPRVKSKVRPPPEKGGKPAPRVDPTPKAKTTKRYPLSRLLQRNQKSHPADGNAAQPAPQAPKGEKPVKPGVVLKKKKLVKKVVPKKPAGPPSAAKSGPGGPFKRRVIPNLQPSPAGQEDAFESMLGPKLITNPKLNKCSTRGCLKDQELVGLYFAAKWKSDCKRFNPLLKDFYFNAAPHNNLEIVYISADRSLLEFKDTYATMPYLAMPAGTTELKNKLTQNLKIIEMPALVILDDEGDVVTVQGAKKIQELEKGNVKQANELVQRWKKTRPIPMEEVKKDMTLLHGTMERGTVYWQS